MTKLLILNGNFIENEKVTVSIDNKTITRRVYYCSTAGDLYIWYKNNKYFYYEFMNQI